MHLFRLEAINDELESIMSNHIWNSLSYILRLNSLVANMCLRSSLNQMDIIDKYNARLMTKGHKQRRHVDYFDTNSLVIRILSIKCYLTMLLFINLL
jgi:hypothetical protein